MRNILILASNVDFKLVDALRIINAEEANRIVNTSKILKENLSKCKNVQVFMVGDGKSDLTLEQIGQVLEKLDKSQPLTIIYNGHGKVGGTGFEFITGENQTIKVQDMFNLIKSKRGSNPVDFFSTACCGGAMHDVRNLLPDKSVLVSLTDAKKENNAGDFMDFARNFPTETKVELTASNLLNLYLQTSLVNRFSPCISKSGGMTYNLDLMLQYFIGRRQQVADLQDKVTEGVLLPSTLEVVPKLNNAKSQWDIYAKDYGKALSVVFTEEMPKIARHNNTSYKNR